MSRAIVSGAIVSAAGRRSEVDLMMETTFQTPTLLLSLTLLLTLTLLLPLTLLLSLTPRWTS